MRNQSDDRQRGVGTTHGRRSVKGFFGKSSFVGSIPAYKGRAGCGMLFRRVRGIGRGQGPGVTCGGRSQSEPHVFARHTLDAYITIPLPYDPMISIDFSRLGSQFLTPMCHIGGVGQLAKVQNQDVFLNDLVFYFSQIDLVFYFSQFAIVVAVVVIVLIVAVVVALVVGKSMRCVCICVG